jgi:zinc/manganese transport system substrate-binding protein
MFAVTRRRLFVATLALGLLPLAQAANGAEPLRVVATFSILADLAREIGGERVRVDALVGPDGDAHVYQPSPADAKRLARAQVVVANGLGFEGWMARLVKAAGYRGEVVVASHGVTPRPLARSGGKAGGQHRQDDVDPHAWQDVANVRQYAENIAAAFARADPEGAAYYRTRRAGYLDRLGALEAELRAGLNAIPAGRRKVVTSHDAFGYFARAYGLEFLAPVGVNTDAEASAADVAKLIRQIRQEHIPAVFLESISDPRLLERVKAETGARIGGSLYSDALSPVGGPASTYLEMMRHNLRTLSTALAP